jgi:hypothetical protein
MFQIVDTFAAVEGLSEKEMQDLFWEQKRLSPTEHCITRPRRFHILSNSMRRLKDSPAD